MDHEQEEEDEEEEEKKKEGGRKGRGRGVRMQRRMMRGSGRRNIAKR